MSPEPRPRSLEDYRRLVDAELDRSIRPEPGMPEEYRLALRTAVTSPGKRIRPTITLLTCQASGGALTEALKAATSIELLHTASLVYDDIVDEDSLRRGQPSLHARFGNDLAMLVAGLIATRALFPIVENRSLARATLDTMDEVVTGEILDIRGDVLTVTDYLNLVSRKTAALFQLAAETGAVCAEAPAGHRLLCRIYGMNLGIVFQIRDDVLDAIGDQERLGKPVGSDLRNGRPSIVSLLASERLDVDLIEFPRALDALGPEKSKACLREACDAAMRLCRDYSERAQSSLDQLERSAHRDLLDDVLRLAMTRAG